MKKNKIQKVSKTKTILVVDDEADIRESVRMILEPNGYKVITAKDADDLLKKIKQKTPDLILLDIMMPGTPVDKVVKQIENIKIAYMSVLGMAEARSKGLCKQDNISDYFQKPFDANDLINRVNLILSE